MKRIEHTNKRKRSAIKSSDTVFNAVLLVLLSLWMIIVLYPLIFVLSSSFSSGTAVSSGRVLLWPVEFSIEGYRVVLSNVRVWSGYANTIYYTLVGTAANMVITVLAAYPLSRKNFQGRAFLSIVFMIPMFVGGGIIPSYILKSNLGLVNTRLGIILTGTLSIYNMTLMRTFFTNSIPNELLESAKMDGISDIGYLFKVTLPLSKAIISVISLYYMVGHWNAYFTPLMYLRDRELLPLQIIIRDILSSSQVKASEIMDPELLAGLAGLADSMKFSLVVVSVLPMLVIYPFVQKFFQKGVMIGSVKG